MAPSCLQLVQFLGFLPVLAVGAGLKKTTSSQATASQAASASTASQVSGLTSCQRIASQLPGRISYSGDSIYANSISSYYAEQPRDLDPGCIFTPTSTADVSKFVKLVTENGTTTSSSPQFAIRSGGHKYIADAANINGGITVDLRSLNNVTLNKDLTVASVGGGAIWSNDVYPNLVTHNLTASGARLPGIGVGGFLTGGGLTYLSRRTGWACDSVVGYEVVLASGEVVNVTQSSNPDLWLALKGGSNNFGIVTRFDISTYPHKGMLGGVIGFNYTSSVLDAQAKAFTNFMKPENYDTAAMMGVLLTNQNGVSAVANSLFYLEPNSSPAVYQPFLSMPGQVSNNLIVDNMANVVNAFGSFTPPALARAIEINYSFKNTNASVYSELFQIYNATLSEMLSKNIPGAGVQWLIQPQPVTNGTNSLGLPKGVTDVVITDMTVGWNNASDDATMVAFLDTMLSRQTQALISKGVYIPFIYLNYAGASQDPIGSYGYSIKSQLQTVSKKYDPNGVFQTLVPGGFKLFT